MKQIQIIREGNKVTFKTVNIDTTETVFFKNMDDQPHKPSILNLVDPEQLGPNQNSSQVPVSAPAGQAPPFHVDYGCQIAGHEKETGTINVFAQLAAGPKTVLQAIKGQAVNWPVVVGGMPPYKITDLIVNNTNVAGTSTGPAHTLPIGNDLKLVQDSQGISVKGTPTQLETYNFTFTVDDSMARNLQQVQYSLTVAAN